MAKDEIITVYDLRDPDRAIPMSRKEFYKEQIRDFQAIGRPTKAVEIIDIFLFNSEGDIIIQKRSDDKAHNPGMLDKSIGGHVQYGDSIDYTAMVETVQELQVPSITLRTHDDFQKTHSLLSSYLNTIAISKHIYTKIINMEKVVQGEKIYISNKVDLYYGVFDGAVKMVDREAKGIMFYTLDDLKKEISQFPDMFTYDLRYFIEHDEKAIKDFIEEIRKKD